MTIRASLRAPLGLLVLLGTTIGGCAESDGSTDVGEGELKASDLKSYGMAVGIVATGKDAQALHKAITESGGKDLGNHAVLAGLTTEELGLATPAKDDEEEPFGIVCQAAAGDSTFHADTCSLSGVVEASKQARGKTTLTGKLAKAIAQALPRTSPAGLVGSMTTGAGPIECKTVPGPTGSTCTVASGALFATFEEMTKGDAAVKVADAKKAILAFFPGA